MHRSGPGRLTWLGYSHTHVRNFSRRVVIGAVVLALSGCTSGSSSKPPASPTTTTIPEALWLGQARVWLAAHGSDLSAISEAAQRLGDAAKAGNGTLTQSAVTQFLIQVGQADGNLPTNAFGQDMHHVFIDYATSLAQIRKGLLNNDQATYKAGSDALAAAVKEFATITTRMKASP